jgi:hypothetical protein
MNSDESTDQWMKFYKFWSQENPNYVKKEIKVESRARQACELLEANKHQHVEPNGYVLGMEDIIKMYGNTKGSQSPKK